MWQYYMTDRPLTSSNGSWEVLTDIGIFQGGGGGEWNGSLGPLLDQPLEFFRPTLNVY